MEVVRNFINVSGLAGEGELPAEIEGQIIQYSETETIFIPQDRPDVKSIYQIMIKVEVKSTREINTPMGKTIVVDGVKKLKIIYTQCDDSGKAQFADLELPYNTFIEIPKHMNLDDIRVYVLDAYFSLLHKRKIYSHLLFFVYAKIDAVGTNNTEDIDGHKDQELNLKLNSDINIKTDDEYKDDSSDIKEEENQNKSNLVDLDAEYL